MNVAFRGTGEAGTWFEDQQAAALQSGDISQFGYTVEVAKLTGGVTEPATRARATTSASTPPTTRSRVDGGQIVYDTGAEGVNYAGIPGRGVPDAGAFGQGFHFVGRNQPYGIFVPSAPAPHGMQLALHGYSANHTSLIDSANPLQEGFQQNIGEALNRIIVVPLGRGPAGFYSDISERDVLDVMADVEANYPVDLDRVFSGGYSMGGYGTLRFATTYPDRFAGYIDWVGYPGDACGQPDIQTCQTGEVGIPAEWLRNLREVDGAMLYSGADELVNSAQGFWLRGLMAARRLSAHLLLPPGRGPLHLRARRRLDEGGGLHGEPRAPHAAAARHLPHRAVRRRTRARDPPRPRLLGLGDRQQLQRSGRARLRRRRHQDLRLRRLGADLRRGSAGRGRRSRCRGSRRASRSADRRRSRSRTRSRPRSRTCRRSRSTARSRAPASTRRPARLPRRHQRTDDDHDLGLSRAELRRGRHLRRDRFARARVRAGLAAGAALLAGLARRQRRARA